MMEPATLLASHSLTGSILAVWCAVELASKALAFVVVLFQPSLPLRIQTNELAHAQVHHPAALPQRTVAAETHTFTVCTAITKRTQVLHVLKQQRAKPMWLAVSGTPAPDFPGKHGRVGNLHRGVRSFAPHFLKSLCNAIQNSSTPPHGSIAFLCSLPRFSMLEGINCKGISMDSLGAAFAETSWTKESLHAHMPATYGSNDTLQRSIF